METFSMPGASSPHLPVFCRGGSVSRVTSSLSGGSGCCCLHSSCSLPGRLRTRRPEVAQLDGQQGGEDPLPRLSPTPGFLLRLFSDVAG